jgi:hypothetical protein
MPITRSGRSVTAANVVIEIDDVLLANSALGEHCASSKLGIELFGGSLDGQIHVERIDRRGRRNTAENRVAFVGRDALFFNRTVEIFLDAG